MEEKFLSSHDTGLRLHNTFVKYKDTVFFAVDAGVSTPTVKLLTVTGSSLAYVIDANDPDLETGNLPVGWCEYETGKTCYVMRTTTRKQKSAVSPDNTYMFFPDGTSCGDNAYPINDIMKTTGFKSMLEGIYPTVDDNLKKFFGLIKKKETASVALSKEICLYGQSCIVYKGAYVIGTISEKEVKLLPQYNNSITTMLLANLGLFAS